MQSKWHVHQEIVGNGVGKANFGGMGQPTGRSIPGIRDFGLKRDAIGAGTSPYDNRGTRVVKQHTKARVSVSGFGDAASRTNRRLTFDAVSQGSGLISPVSFGSANFALIRRSLRIERVRRFRSAGVNSEPGYSLLSNGGRPRPVSGFCEQSAMHCRVHWDESALFCGSTIMDRLATISRPIGQLLFVPCLLAMTPSLAVAAHQDPPGCTASGATAIPYQYPNSARHGEEVCVWVEFSNLCVGCCSVEGDAELVLGDDTVVPVIQDAWIQQGDYFVCPSDDPRCIAPSNCTIDGVPGYRFVVDHADEHGSVGWDCPPVAEAGFGIEDMHLMFFAVSHGGNDVGAASCRSIAIRIDHDLCTDSCPNGEVCVGGICVPPTCNHDGTCDEGENCSSCPEDCASLDAGCGNGICEAGLGENCQNCSADCNGLLTGKRNAQFCCGSGAKGLPGGCDDSRCTDRGYQCSNSQVSACCGDGVCGAMEDGCNCANDCEDPCPCRDRGVACAADEECCSGVCTGRGVCR